MTNLFRICQKGHSHVQPLGAFSPSKGALSRRLRVALLGKAMLPVTRTVLSIISVSRVKELRFFVLISNAVEMEDPALDDFEAFGRSIHPR